MKKLKNSKGFTLMEMLIVVAIIAILVAIAIPSFTKQLEKAREAADMANIRSAYAEVMAAAMTNDTTVGSGNDDVKYEGTKAGSETWSKHVTATQKEANWQSGNVDSEGKIAIGDTKVAASKVGWNVVYSNENNTVTITAEGTTKSSNP